METYGDPGFGRHVSVYNATFVFGKLTFRIQVAIAKHLGLQTVRLADSIVLPINTTHHAIELGKYLDKSVPLHSLYVSH